MVSRLPSICTVHGEIVANAAVKLEEAPDFSGASSSSVAIWRRRADSPRRIEVLQTPALSHLATSPFIFDCDSII